MNAPSPSDIPSPLLRLSVVTVLVGIGAGLGGMALALLLHLIQHWAFGYSPHALVGMESFLQGVDAASPLRRVLVLVLCGVVAGFGWWAVYNVCKPLVSIAKACRADDPRMPGISTIGHALLQIVTVALGSPLGREVAPREIGALFAGWLAHRAGLGLRERQIMLACGAGAGLAAVYNVPLGGALFVMEVLLGSFAWPVAIPAIASSVIATVVAWIGLGNVSQYVVPAFHLNASLLVWSMLAGPLFGLAANGFTRLAVKARQQAPRDRRLPLMALLNFAVIGLLAMQLPALLGNGKGPSQLGFDSALGIGMAAVLLVLKLLITTSSLRAGAEGGLLTPGLTLGALLAIVLGGLWSHWWPGPSSGAFALIGAAAFLAASMRMPLTAVVLMLEFTRVDQDALVPILLAVGGSLAAFKLAEGPGWQRLLRRPARQQGVPMLDDLPQPRGRLAVHHTKITSAGVTDAAAP